MTLMPSYFSTSGSGKGRKLPSTASSRKAAKDHEKFLRSIGLSTSGSKSFSKGKVLRRAISVGDATKKTSDVIAVPNSGGKKDTMTYSGDKKLLGIAVLHKSCLQPVFSEEAAKDIARMRRG